MSKDCKRPSLKVPTAAITYGCRCPRCVEYIKSRQSDFKQAAVDYLGGKCMLCGYSKCNAALEFHHKGNKEKHISRFRSLTSGAKGELKKCMLLCSNCHRELHYQY